MSENPTPPPKRPHPLEAPPPRPRSAPPQTPNPSSGKARVPLGPNQILLRIPTVQPYVTYVLIAINVAIFAIRALFPSLNLLLVDMGANNQTAVLVNGEFHRLLTSMFLHASLFDARGQLLAENALHIAFNMYALWIIGAPQERMFGHVRYGLIYLLGGLTGSVFSALLGGPDIYSIGASGAVFAVFGAEFVFWYRHRLLFGAGGRAHLRSLATLLVINLAFGLLANLGNGVQIDNLAHIGGLIGGLILTWFLGPYYNLRRDPEKPMEFIAEDTNPLKNNVAVVVLYASALLLALIAGRLILNGG
ncbi:MAG: rhomboid family intramembrane serine protease [Anaerolineae bacterium]